MTKPRAMLAGDDPDADPTISCLAAIRAPPREAETAPRTADGERLLCKKFCRGGADGAAACARPDCPDAHVPIAERQACWTFERYGVCKFEEARERDPAAPQCWFPHPTPPPATHHLALQVEVGMSDRVVSRCRELLGDDVRRRRRASGPLPQRRRRHPRRRRRRGRRGSGDGAGRRQTSAVKAQANLRDGRRTGPRRRCVRVRRQRRCAGRRVARHAGVARRRGGLRRRR